MSPEDLRLDALHQLNLLDTPPSEAFDRITRMAAQIFNLPIAAVSLTDSDRQWFKSRVGLEQDTVARVQAPCAQVAESTTPLVIPDLLADRGYADSPLAVSGVRFYAGAPLVTRDGFGLGSLCVLGGEPRSASAAEMAGLSDLADMVMAQIELQHAFGRIDPISGLPNRNQFLEDMADLARQERGQRRLVTLVDLAPSERLNQGMRVMGPAFIDDLVRAAASNLRAMLGKSRIAYHISTTQFAFLAPLGSEDQSYLALVDALLGDIRLRSQEQFAMTLAIGVAPLVVGTTLGTDVLRLAYSAAQDARANGLLVSLYSRVQDGHQTRLYGLLHDFGAALLNPGELRLVYQPRIDLATRRCLGAEVLLRWEHPLLGDVSPMEFIPIIEQTNLIRPTTDWVLDAALRQLGLWAAAGMKVHLSINISASNLTEIDFVERVQLYLLKHRVSPDLLELEVTESAIMTDPVLALERLAALAEAGVGIAIDDFGTGHSSLAYLQRLPVGVVKIDRSFVQNLDQGDAGELTLVASMIQLSHNLGFRVVAEGVETAATADLLATLACDEAQGYHFARPLERAVFEHWFDRAQAPAGAMRAAGR